jgi:Putative transposase/Periplasmic binding protein domain
MYPQIEVVASAIGNYQRADGKREAARILAQHPRIDGIMAANDFMALGAIEALEEAGRTATVAGMNAVPDAIKAIKDGKLLATVSYDALSLVCTAAVADIAWQNKAVVYDLLFKAAAETTLTIAADPRHLGAKIGITAVLHTWGSAMTHHPHIHMIVPGGGLSADGTRWVACRPAFFLPVRVLSRLFRRLFLGMLAAAHAEGRLAFFGALETRAIPRAFAAFLKRQRRVEWVTYAKAPFAGPKQVLAYLARYTHRIAISNRRLIRADADGVTFKDYRVDGPGASRP